MPKASFWVSAMPKATVKFRSLVLSSHPAPGQPQRLLLACGDKKGLEQGSFRVKANKQRRKRKGPLGLHMEGNTHIARSKESAQLHQGPFARVGITLRSLREGGNLYPKIFLGASLPLKGRATPAT